MNKLQKAAWFGLIGMVVYPPILVAVVYFEICSIRTFVILSAIGMIGLCFLPRILKRKNGKVTCDERDETIKKNAAYAGLMAMFGYICILTWILQWKYGKQGVIPVKDMLGFLWYAIVIFGLINCLAILIQYGRGGKENE